MKKAAIPKVKTAADTLQKRSTKREEIEETLAKVNAELSKANADVGDQKRQVEAIRSKLSALEERFAQKTSGGTDVGKIGASVRLSLKEERLSPREMEELTELRGELKAAVNAVERLESVIAGLMVKESELTQAIMEVILSSSREEMLNFQENVKTTKQRINALNEAIRQQEEIISGAKEGIQTSDDLMERRTEILAEIATGGNSTEKDLESIDQQIEEREQSVKEIKLKARRSIADAEQTITGIRLILSKAEDELQCLEKERNGMLHRFLLAEAERAGGEYLIAVNSVLSHFRRLIALNNILKKNGFGEIRSNKAEELLLPAFRLQAHVGMAGRTSQDRGQLEIINTASSWRAAQRESDIQAEKTRLESLGVEL